MGSFTDFGIATAGDVLSTGLGIISNNMLQKQNFKWSEKAAENAYQRQLALYNRMYEDKSPVNVVKQLGEAGLNKALMFSGGAGGVGGAASGTSAPQGGQFQALGINKINMAMQMAQIENIKADTAKKQAEAKTTTDTRDPMVNKLIAEGHGNWLKNFQEQYKMNTPQGGDHIDYNDPNKGYYGNDKIKEGSYFTQEITSNITKSLAEAGNANANALLTNEKAKGYWQELLNDTVRADSAKIQATAQKLASEWSTGEFTNWKTWADLASKTVGDLIKIGK